MKFYTYPEIEHEMNDIQITAEYVNLRKRSERLMQIEVKNANGRF